MGLAVHSKTGATGFWRPPREGLGKEPRDELPQGAALALLELAEILEHGASMSRVVLMHLMLRLSIRCQGGDDSVRTVAPQIGLTAGFARFQKAPLLESARRLGDFYVTTAAEAFCDPRRTNEYQQASAYAGAYVTCYFEAMEGLVQLYRLTRDQRYLNTALRMADFHEQFDTLPVGHSHGSLSQHEALLMLYEETGKTKYLNRVAARWDAAVKGGYVSPAGGVLEKFVVTGYNRDEGCSEADWLRVCLMLWRNTGQTRYLDMAERTLWNEYFANQWADGAYGHRLLGVDNAGPYAFHEYSEKALWCCSFHGPLALNEFKSYLAVAAPEGIFYNFPVDFHSPVAVSRAGWLVQSRSLPPLENVPVRCEVKLTRQSGSGKVPLLIRRPEWAEKVVIKVDGKEAADQANRRLPQNQTPGIGFGGAN